MQLQQGVQNESVNADGAHVSGTEESLAKESHIFIIPKFFRRLPPNVTKGELQELFNLTLFPTGRTVNNSSLEIYDRILRMNNITLTELMNRLSPDCLDMISRCIWKGIKTRCESLFQRIVTIQGICCSFNFFATMTNNFPV